MFIVLNNGKRVYLNSGDGVPSGGAVTEVVTKASTTDYDTEWGSGGGSGAITAAVLISVDEVNPDNTQALKLTLADTTVVVVQKLDVIT